MILSASFCHGISCTSARRPGCFKQFSKSTTSVCEITWVQCRAAFSMSHHFLFLTHLIHPNLPFLCNLSLDVDPYLEICHRCNRVPLLTSCLYSHGSFRFLSTMCSCPCMEFCGLSVLYAYEPFWVWSFPLHLIDMLTLVGRRNVMKCF